MIDSRNQRVVHESIGKKSARDVSIEVNEVIPPVFADWLDMDDSYYRTEKGTVLHLHRSTAVPKAVLCPALISARSV